MNIKDKGLYITLSEENSIWIKKLKGYSANLGNVVEGTFDNSFTFSPVYGYCEWFGKFHNS